MKENESVIWVCKSCCPSTVHSLVSLFQKRLLSHCLPVWFDSDDCCTLHSCFCFSCIVTSSKVKPPSVSSRRFTRSECKTWTCFFNSPTKACQIWSASHSPLCLFCAVCSLARSVDDLECFHHLFLPGGWRPVKGKEDYFCTLIKLHSVQLHNNNKHLTLQHLHAGLLKTKHFKRFYHNSEARLKLVIFTKSYKNGWN